MEPTTSPVLLRATLTEQEYRELKKAAIDEDKTNADLVGAILRAYLAERGTK